MALPWHIPLEKALHNKSKKAPPRYSSMFKHNCNLDIHETPSEDLRTGLMCDIGIVNREPATIVKLIAAGMTVARLNVEGLELNVSKQLLQSLRQAVLHYSAELEYAYPLAVVIDIYGPEIVTGDLKGGKMATLDLDPFSILRLSTDDSFRDCGNAECLYINCDYLEEVNPKDIIYMDCLTPGKIKLIVLAVGDDSIDCSVVKGGIIGSRMAVKITHPPNETTKSGKHHPELASYDEDSEFVLDPIGDQISWAISADVDGLLILNTETADDIRRIRDILIKKEIKTMLVFACIDTTSALDNFDEILTVADGIYVDRCILSTDLPVEKIFIALKSIVAKCNETGKPCICKAVVNEQTPTICVTDIANLVLDGVDVIELEFSYDSPLQKFSTSNDSVKMAIQCLEAAAVICRQAERVIWKPLDNGYYDIPQIDADVPTKSIAVTVAELAMRSRAVVIICFTHSGLTAKMIAHVLPTCPVVAVSKACNTVRQLRFWRGVRTMHYFEEPKPSWQLELESRIRAALDYCKNKNILRAGEPYILVNMTAQRGPRYCDKVRLLFASNRL